MPNRRGTAPAKSGKLAKGRKPNQLKSQRKPWETPWQLDLPEGGGIIKIQLKVIQKVHRRPRGLD